MIKHVLRVVQAHLRERKKSRERSPQWDNVRDAFIKKQPLCLACGDTKHLQVHHVKPFHLHPELELDEHNLIVLCMGAHECHLLLGHGDSFQSHNPHVREHAKRFRVAYAKGRAEIVAEAKRVRLPD